MPPTRPKQYARDFSPSKRPRRDGADSAACISSKAGCGDSFSASRGARSGARAILDMGGYFTFFAATVDGACWRRCYAFLADAGAQERAAMAAALGAEAAQLSHYSQRATELLLHAVGITRDDATLIIIGAAGSAAEAFSPALYDDFKSMIRGARPPQCHGRLLRSASARFFPQSRSTPSRFMRASLRWRRASDA